jgi:WD40 repeat protein
VNASLLPVGFPVEHFVVERLLGRGGMGEVYLARDTRLGRRVALKLVRMELLRSAHVADQFLVEAQTTARFNHPNIVSVFSIGQVALSGRPVPYLVLEYLEGVSLAERQRKGLLAPRPAMRLGMQVASALAEAHRHGVVHGDLKPTNVMLPRDGRARVVDFGVAVALHAARSGASSSSSSSGRAGTPRFMAPERWAGETRPPSDIWALGVVLFYAITGRHPLGPVLVEGDDTTVGTPTDSGTLEPFDSISSVDRLLVSIKSGKVPPRLDGIADVPSPLADLLALMLEPEPARRPVAQVVEDALARMLAAPAVAATAPYRGLMAFDGRHEGLFFGREEEIADLVERSRRLTVLPVVGPSGAGKSSFVAAGFIPRLKEERAWRVLSLRPGHAALRALARVVLPPGSARWASPEALEADLRISPALLALVLREQADGTGVLLFVDQLEEIFSHGLAEDEQVAFLEAICLAADDLDRQVRVVFTLRDDFLGRVAVSPAARRSMDGVTVLQRMDRARLRAAVEEPLAVFGYRLEDGAIAEEMVEAVSGEAAGLPLLQFTARMLWDRRDVERKLLLRSAYEELDGVAGALASHADGVLGGMSASDRELARRLLLQLVAPTQTRRRRARAELLEVVVGAEGVLDRLVASRLLSVAEERAGGSTVELAHESLIVRWGTLARWLAATAGQLTLREEARIACERWQRNTHAPEELWRGRALEDAAVLLEDEDLPLGVRAFLQAGLSRARWTHRRKRLVVWAALLFAGIVGVTLAIQKNQAEAQRGLAEQREHQATVGQASALAEAARAAAHMGRLPEARAKLRMAMELVDLDSTRSLGWALTLEPLLWAQEASSIVYDVAYAPDGGRIAAVTEEGALQLMDAFTGEGPSVLTGLGVLLSVEFLPDGDALILGTHDGRVTRWDLQKGQATWAAELDGNGAWGMDASPDGSLVAVTAGPRALLFDTQTGAPAGVLEGPGGLDASAVRFGDAGRRIVTGGTDGRLHLWDRQTLLLERTLEGHEETVRGLDLVEGLLVSAGRDRQVQIWDPENGALIHAFEGARDWIWDVRIHPDGRRILVSDARGGLAVFNRGGRRLGAIAGSGAIGTGLDISGDGERVAVGSFSPGVAELRIEMIGLSHAPVPASDMVDLFFSRDGALFAFEPGGGIWRFEEGTPVPVLEHVTNAEGVDATPNADRFVASERDGTVVWDVAAPRQPVALLRRGGGQVEISSDGQTVAVVSEGRLWLAHLGGPDWLDLGQWGPFDLGPTALVATRGSALTVWALDGAEIAQLELERRVSALALHPDGSSVALAYKEGAVHLLDWASGAVEVLWTPPHHVHALNFDTAGERLAMGGYRGMVAVYDFGLSRAQVRHAGLRSTESVAFNLDGSVLASGHDDGVLGFWDSATLRRRGLVPALVERQGAWWLLGKQAVPLGSLAPPPTGRWTDMTEVELADDDGRLLCTVDRAGALRGWGLAAEHPDLAGTARSPEQVLSVAGGCAVRDADGAWFLGAGGRVVLGSDVTVIGRGGEGELAVADPSGVAALDVRTGEEAQRWPVATGGVVSVVAASGGPYGPVAAIGRASGRVEVHQWAGWIPLAEPFEAEPTLIRLVAPGLMVVGYETGQVGIWRMEGGLVHAEDLQGRVLHLGQRGHQVVVATEMGDHLLWDLELLGAARCDVLRSVWSDVGVVWEDGAPRRRPPPEGHPCSVSTL